jgi:hypothetical protein
MNLQKLDFSTRKEERERMMKLECWMNLQKLDFSTRGKRREREDDEAGVMDEFAKA